MSMIEYTRRIKEEDLIKVLSTAYMKSCLPDCGENIEYAKGAANTIGFIVGALGLDPEVIIAEAKKKKMEADK